MPDKITVQTAVAVPLKEAWEYWTQPEHITKWNFASDDWECPSATNDLRTGGTFTSRMQSKETGEGFDFGGVYTEVEPMSKIAYEMGDGRQVEVLFKEIEFGTQIIETFDPETINSADRQRSGWQSIMDNFKKYAESQAAKA